MTGNTEVSWIDPRKTYPVRRSEEGEMGILDRKPVNLDGSPERIKQRMVLIHNIPRPKKESR